MVFVRDKEGVSVVVMMMQNKESSPVAIMRDAGLGFGIWDLGFGVSGLDSAGTFSFTDIRAGRSRYIIIMYQYCL